ncbi:MAG TPA: hypothetical protein VJ914_01475 [Pseudonocardiaceae bacterium]|nr:hypothetical protein [Pseudonocardiaceae bacterium]
MTYAPPLPATTDWRTKLPARLGAAVLVGALTGGATLLAGTLMPVAQIPVGCRPNAGIGCAIAAPLTGILLGAFFWLIVVGVTALGASFAFSGLSAWLLRIRLGVAGPLAWPVMLWAIALLLQAVGLAMRLSGIAVPGYIALAFVLTTTLTAPQIRLTARLIATGALVVVVVLALALR